MLKQIEVSNLSTFKRLLFLIVPVAQVLAAMLYTSIVSEDWPPATTMCLSLTLRVIKNCHSTDPNNDVSRVKLPFHRWPSIVRCSCLAIHSICCRTLSRRRPYW